MFVFNSNRIIFKYNTSNGNENMVMITVSNMSNMDVETVIFWAAFKSVINIEIKTRR